MKAPPATLFVLPLVLVTVRAAVAPPLQPTAQIVHADSARNTLKNASTTKVTKTTERSVPWDERAPGVTVASNCSQCRVREEVINLTKEAIKQQILSKLGFQREPNITGKTLPRMPPFTRLIDLYQMQSDSPSPAFEPGPVYEETEDDYHAQAQIILTIGKETPRAWGFAPDLHVQYFPLAPRNGAAIERVVSARLWFYLKPSKVSVDKHINVHVHHVQTGENLRPVLSHFQTKNILLDNRGMWVDVEVEKLVIDWVQHPKRNRGLVIEAFDKNGRNLVNTDPNESNGTLMPFIEIRMTEEKKTRRKRMIGLNCEEKSNEVRCCRYPLTVDFEEFGWDWIIAPKKYEANYCSGNVRLFFFKNTRTHIWCSNRTGQDRPVHVVHPANCPPYRCFILTKTII